MNSYSMGFGSIYMIATWILVGFSTYALIKFMLNKKNANTGSDSDINILNKRYAKGEIDSEEYRKIKKDLREN